MNFFVISVLTLNIILWIVLLVRFKKLFSTDSIVDKTQKKLNELIKEIDNAADRDTFLAKETSKRIQNTLDDAEKKMELFKEATQRLRDMIAEADRLTNVKTKIVKSEIDPDSAFELNISNNKNQNSLFNDNELSQKDVYHRPEKQKIQKDEIYITEDGAAYKEIPLIITKVYDDEPKKTSPLESGSKRSKQVESMYNEGFTAEQIAAKLNCSVTEIQFIIDMM